MDMDYSYRPNILRIVTVWISLVCCSCCAKKDIQVDSECPPWFFYDASTKTCKCYSSPSTDHIVRCTEKEALLKLGYCMTYEDENGFHVGLCDNIKISSLNMTQGNYIRLPSNVSDLNDYMCGPTNRKGRMCGQCIDGFGLAVFSVEYICTNCTGAWYGVPLYLFMDFVPITIFYFIVMFFHINVTSAPMVAFVFYSQLSVSAFSMVSNKLIFNTTTTYFFLKILVSFYGIWNLDFFRILIPPFCISPYIKPIHSTFLYFISAIYPLCLIALSWICIHLHSRNFKPLVWLWNKVKQIFHGHFNINLDATSTIVDVFATFFLLSYAKLVYASLNTLYYGISLNVNIFSMQQTLHVKSDPTMKYFGTEHLPFAIISLFIFLFTVLPIPILLALYPFRHIRTILFKCPIGSRATAAINLFVQKFYNCYRDSTGTEGERDLRSLVSVYFFLRLLIHIVTVEQIPSNVGFSILVFIYVACSTLISLAQPYKKAYMNIADTLILANLAILCLLLSQLNGELPTTSLQFYYTSGSILASLPLLGIIGILVWKIIKKVAKLPYCKRLLQSRQHDRQDTNPEDADLQIIECHEDRDLEECVVSVKEYDE